MIVFRPPHTDTTGGETVPARASERFQPVPTLTSTEAAELLGVHASTVKRWCNEGALRFATTDGGHRRFRMDDLMDFAREREIRTVLTPFHPYETDVWSALRSIHEGGSFEAIHELALGWIREGQVDGVGRLYRTLAELPGVRLCTFCDQAVRGLMTLMGEEWRAGRLRVGEEHMVSQVLLETLIRLRASRAERRRPSSALAAPVAVVGTMEGNQHHMGSMCVRLLLEALGWHVDYLGPNVPLEDFAVVQRAREARLVCISLAPPASGGEVARAVETLARYYDDAHPFALAFGGTIEGNVETDLLRGPFDGAGLFSSCLEFREALQAGFARSGRRAAR